MSACVEQPHMEKIAVVLILMKKYSTRWREHVRKHKQGDGVEECSDRGQDGLDDHCMNTDNTVTNGNPAEVETHEEHAGFAHVAYTIVCVRKCCDKWKIAAFEHRVFDDGAPEVTIDTGDADEMHVSTNSTTTQTRLGRLVFTVLTVKRFVHSLKRSRSGNPGPLSHKGMRPSYHDKTHVTEIEENNDDRMKKEKEVYNKTNKNEPGVLSNQSTNDDDHFQTFLNFACLVMCVYKFIRALQRSALCRSTSANVRDRMYPSQECTNSASCVEGTDRPPPVISLVSCSCKTANGSSDVGVFSTKIQAIRGRTGRPDRYTCLSCWRETVRVVFLPCGHLATCVSCAAAMDRCPVCGQAIDTKIKTYHMEP